MNDTDRPRQAKASAVEKVNTANDSLSDTAMIEFATVLDDYMDEEVVDKEGSPIGTLACYWQSVSGRLVFLGIKVKGHEAVHVVPGHRSQVDDRQACIRLGFDLEDIESAPQLECAADLDTTIERAVYKHFEVEETQPHGGLWYFARQS